MTSESPLPDRCAAECRSGGYCENYPVDGADRCRMHGGTQPKGMDSPNAVHGLRSDYLTEEDEEIYEEVRQHDNAALVQEEIWAIKTKLLRAARAADGEDGHQLAQDMLEKIEDGQADDEVVRALAKLLKTSTGAVDRAIGRLNDLVKTHHKITEGETVNVDHSGRIDGERTLGDEELAAIREGLAASGGDDA
jgi:uncharacterized protein YggU (UPF0235/DUF167 family)